MHLSSQLFFKTPHQTLKFKVQQKCIFQRSADLNSKNFPSGSTMEPPYRVSELSKQ